MRVPNRIFAVATLLLWSEQVVAQDLQLSVPLQCSLGVDCFVQNYVDIDPGQAVLAADCGQVSYNGHKGTDFRVLNTRVAADVLAAAPGTVRALRNDMADRLVRTKEDRQAVQNRECGNGVVVSHGDGWETQYCHLRKGTVTVSVGDRIERGQPIGQVGYSGLAAFPHVHLTLRHNGETVDPFLGTVSETRRRAQACKEGAETGVPMATSLWLDPALELLDHANGTLIETGLAGGPVGTLELETASAPPASARAPALVFFARLINLKKGDRVVLKLTGPNGLIAQSDGQPLEKNKAQWVAFTGRKTKPSGWDAGTYVGEVALVRDGKEVLSETAELDLTD